MVQVDDYVSCVLRGVPEKLLLLSSFEGSNLIPMKLLLLIQGTFTIMGNCSNLGWWSAL
jgi:hypothetical protein